MSDPQPVQMTRRGVLHLYPAFEPCNLDDAAAVTIFLLGVSEAAEDPRFRRICRRCRHRVEET